MARKRVIDPSFWDDEDLIGANASERLLFIGLFSLADDYGHITAHPAILRKGIFAYDEATSVTDVERMRDVLYQRCRNVTPYCVNGQDFIWMRGFRRHQDLRFRAKAQYPCHACGRHHSAKDVEDAGCEDQPVSAEFLRISTQDIAHICDEPCTAVDMSRVELSRVEQSNTCPPPAGAAPDGAPVPEKPAKTKNTKPSAPSGYTPDFEVFWEDYPRKEGKLEAFKDFQKALKAGIAAPALIAGARHYAEHCQMKETEKQYTLLAKNFIKNGRYEEYQNPPDPNTVAKKGGSSGVNSSGTSQHTSEYREPEKPKHISESLGISREEYEQRYPPKR